MSLQSIADALFAAEADRAAIDAPGAGLDVEGAYAVQQLNVQRKLAAGARLVGRKVGITSRAVMDWLKVNEPDFGALLDTMLVDYGGACERASLLQARVEGEVAFVLDRDLDDEGVTAVDVVRATAWVSASIEIIDSRVRDWKLTLVDTVADNASSARFVVSSTKRSLTGLDLPLVGCALRKNGRVVSTGAGAACLGNPVNAVAWLARTLVKVGTPLRAGDVVLSGALCPVVPVEAGDVIELQVGSSGSAGVGRCSVRFT
jgi:2-oxopent-4-enoate/cis-2-oxohex-4-enoate hydratase